MLYTQGSSTYRYGHSKEDTNIFTYKPWSWGASLDQVWPAFPHLAEQQMMVTCSMGNHPKFDKHGHWIEHVAFCSAAHHYFPYCWLSIDLSIFLFSYPFPALDSCVVSSFSFRYKRKITRERGRERERQSKIFFFADYQRLTMYLSIPMKVQSYPHVPDRSLWWCQVGF